MTEKEYKRLMKIYTTIFNVVTRRPREEIEALAHDALIRYLKQPSRAYKRTAIDVLRETSGKRTSKSYGERQRMTRFTVPFNARKHGQSYEIEMEDFPTEWSDRLKAVARGLIAGKTRTEIARDLGVTQGRVSQIISERLK